MLTDFLTRLYRVRNKGTNHWYVLASSPEDAKYISMQTYRAKNPNNLFCKDVTEIELKSNIEGLDELLKFGARGFPYITTSGKWTYRKFSENKETRLFRLGNRRKQSWWVAAEDAEEAIDISLKNRIVKNRANVIIEHDCTNHYIAAMGGESLRKLLFENKSKGFCWYHYPSYWACSDKFIRYINEFDLDFNKRAIIPRSNYGEM